MINMRKNRIILLFFILSGTLLFQNCTKDEDDNPGVSGTISLEITDAPVDDANVQGVFVTIAEVKLDGKTFEGFQTKQTIDLMAYQNGNAKLLGAGEMEARSYSNITLVLDQEQDSAGNAPGCYVLTNDGKKHNLSAASSASNEITFSSAAFEVEKDGQTDLVIDFDLRKTITREGNSSETDYAFTTETELKNGLRWVKKMEAGKVEGECQDGSLFSDKIIVFAYKKGTFDKNVETSGQGASNIVFSNAITSVEVQSNGQFELNFLEEGEYDLFFAGYKDTDSDGVFELEGNIVLDLLSGSDVTTVSVDANASVSLNVVATGLLPF